MSEVAARTTSQKRRRIAARVLAGLLLCILCGAGAWTYWKTHRAQPPELRKEVFRGVTLQRVVRSAPRPLVICIVTIKLDAPSLSFLVTPRENGGKLPLRAQNTSAFARQHGASLAINADSFSPWWSRTILNYYPHVGDEVKPAGIAASRGDVYARGSVDARGKIAVAPPALFLSRENRASFEKPVGKVYNAVSGLQMILRAGRVSREAQTFKRDRPEPRTAAALDVTGKKLMFFVIDGRQPNYSEGVTLSELAKIAREFGGHNALNLDGGGSTTLVLRNRNGEIEVFNSPINNGIPGRERAVGNHIGVFAAPL